MKLPLALLFILGTCIAPSATAQTEFPATSSKEWKDEPAFPGLDASDDLQTFGLSLLKKELAARKGNLCLSPYAAALSLTRLIPKATSEELHRILDNLPQAGTLRDIRATTFLSLQAADRLFVDTRFPFKHDYTLTLYHAKQPREIITALDIATSPEQSRQTIRRQLEPLAHKNGEKQLLPGDITDRTALMAWNTAWIENKWNTPFPPQSTRDRAFFPEHGKTAYVPTMHHIASHPLLLSPDCSAIELNYAPDSALLAKEHRESLCSNFTPSQSGSMIIILPPENTTIDHFVQNLTVDKIAQIRRKLMDARHGAKPVSLTLPRFQTNTSVDLLPSLTALGMNSELSEQSAFATIFTTEKPPAISGIFQNCGIVISEQGANTGTGEQGIPAATSHTLQDEQNAITFEINRPFLWIIVPHDDHSRSPALFMGIVREP